MAVCRGCGSEYPDGGVCPVCGAGAIDPVLVLTAGDEMELSSAAALLEQARIPYYMQDRETGAYMRIVAGRSLYGTELYVDRRDMRRARQALSPLESEPFDEQSLLDEYDAFMEQQDEDTPAEEECARKDGGSWHGFCWFLGAFGAFLLLLLLVRLLT